MRVVILLSAVTLVLTNIAGATSSRPGQTFKKQVTTDTRHQLKDGLYVPIKSNNPSVCPLELKTYRTDGKLTAVAATYVGDCYQQGPYEYYCYEEDHKLLCWSPFDIIFLVRDATHFLWHNKPYDIWAEFEQR